ncbi:hypothetical protein KC19_12G113700 [Ceratodon purpureus]|uniref:LRAT domain-containing protein n=1 Tax=Ceratodon purpureus TaxID=3225 RepID=A0A8T0G715_CERPU|nr:hypothetical protein KC19_12G113700 [Ceratodon purpureus]
MSLFSKLLRPLELGDHIWYHTHRGLIQHHRIYVGNGHVIHFDDNDTDRRYGHCKGCIESLNNRPGGYVRYSCLACWRLGDATRNIYLCKYDKKLLSLIMRETGSRSMERSHPGHVIAARAWWYFENDNFGRWELFSHNCEDFSRFCTILKLGSKQSIRGLLLIAALRGIVVRTVLGFAALRVLRSWKQAKLLRDLPQNLSFTW